MIHPNGWDVLDLLEASIPSHDGSCMSHVSSVTQKKR